MPVLLAHHEHTITMGAALAPFAPFAIAVAGAWIRERFTRQRSGDPAIHHTHTSTNHHEAPPAVQQGEEQ